MITRAGGKASGMAIAPNFSAQNRASGWVSRRYALNSCQIPRKSTPAQLVAVHQREKGSAPTIEKSAPGGAASIPPGRAIWPARVFR